MTRPAKLTKSSSSSSSVELSTGTQRCSCCFQQREAEIFRSLAGHGDCNLKRDSNSVTSDEAQTSLTSAEAKKREIPDAMTTCPTAFYTGIQTYVLKV